MGVLPLVQRPQPAPPAHLWRGFGGLEPAGPVCNVCIRLYGRLPGALADDGAASAQRHGSTRYLPPSAALRQTLQTCGEFGRQARLPRSSTLCKGRVGSAQGAVHRYDPSGSQGFGLMDGCHAGELRRAEVGPLLGPEAEHV